MTVVRGQDFDGGISVESLAAQLVGVIGFPVVLKAVDDAVAIHVHTEQKLRRVYIKAQEWLRVVGLGVEVAVEIRDVVVVLVNAREDRGRQSATAAPAAC